MFIQHTEEYKALFNEESLIEVLKEYLIGKNYDLKYSNFGVKDFEVSFTVDGKPQAVLHLQKKIKEIGSENHEEIAKQQVT